MHVVMWNGRMYPACTNAFPQAHFSGNMEGPQKCIGIIVLIEVSEKRQNVIMNMRTPPLKTFLRLHTRHLICNHPIPARHKCLWNAPPPNAPRQSIVGLGIDTVLFELTIGGASGILVR